jgi:hypothetical protein
MTATAPGAGAPTVLLIGIHREELAFGRAVARGLDDPGIAVLEIPEGLSGRRPRPDQRFHYETLHRALCLQLLPHLAGHCRLLIDLHTGLDRQGPSADLMCADCGRRKKLWELDEKLHCPIRWVRGRPPTRSA